MGVIKELTSLFAFCFVKGKKEKGKILVIQLSKI